MQLDPDAPASQAMNLPDTITVTISEEAPAKTQSEYIYLKFEGIKYYYRLEIKRKSAGDSSLVALTFRKVK